MIQAQYPAQTLSALHVLTQGSLPLLPATFASMPASAQLLPVKPAIRQRVTGSSLGRGGKRSGKGTAKPKTGGVEFTAALHVPDSFKQFRHSPRTNSHGFNTGLPVVHYREASQ